MSLYFSTGEGSPSLSSQGNTQFEWGLADSFEGNPGTWTRLPTRPTPCFISTTSKQGTDMSLYRASHRWGWQWWIPCSLGSPTSSIRRHAQTRGLTAPWLQRFTAARGKSHKDSQRADDIGAVCPPMHVDLLDWEWCPEGWREHKGVGGDEKSDTD